jgi:predicted nucleotidyltransferase
MRLPERERAALREIVRRADPAAEVCLYGSRADDALKGGDIDLLIVSERLTLADKLDFLVQMKDALGERRIDILIRTSESARSDPFARDVLKKTARRL